MRKNSPRKWLHAILDLLPVILIPVFMIYSHRHTIDSYSVTRQERVNQPYNFYQYVLNGKPIYDYDNDDINNWTFDNLYLDGITNDNYIVIRGNDDDYGDLFIDNTLDVEITNNITQKVYLQLECYSDDEFEIEIDNDIIYSFTTTNTPTIYNYIFNFTYDISFDYHLNIHVPDSRNTLYLRNCQLFNLTNIFGSGNEPTKEEFESMLSQNYYNYGNNYVDNYVMVSKTYNDTDIMSQFTYNLYNSVDKYFNMNNVFGMNNVYTWFETNIFHETAPLYIYIVWNIVLYEFVMDLLMLLYSLFMWFIDICQNLIDRCYSSSKGGN